MWALQSDSGCTLAASSNLFTTDTRSKKCPYSNFLKSCAWSPDGTHLLTSSDDNFLRVFPLPADVAEVAVTATQDVPRNQPYDTRPLNSVDGSLQPSAEAHQGESVYDVKWYPGFICNDPISACFASTSRGHPVHLWDAFTGTVRTSYRVYDEADEVTSAYCLQFHTDCTRLLGGLKNKVAIWDLSRPGRDYRTLKMKGQDAHHKGIVSSLAVSPGGDLIAAGSFNSMLGIYDDVSGSLAMLLHGHKGGITHVQFSRCGNFVYSGARQDGKIYCWDVRYTCECLYEMTRATTDSNQRIGFDIEPVGRHLISGGTDGHVRVYDLTDGSQCAAWPVATDTVNGVSVHPVIPLVATSSGHRRFKEVDEEIEVISGVAESFEHDKIGCNQLSVWQVGMALMEAFAEADLGPDHTES